MNQKQPLWLIWTVALLFLVALLCFVGRDWQPKPLNNKQFNQHYVLNITENGQHIKSGVGVIKDFKDDNMTYNITINKTLNHQGDTSIAIAIGSKRLADKDKDNVSQLSEICVNKCSLAGNKVVSYQAVNAKHINAKLILGLGFLLSILLYFILRRIDNFNRLMFLGLSLILLYRLAMSLGLVAQKMSGVHYVLNNLLLLLILPTLLAIWTIPNKNKQMIKLKKPIMGLVVLCAYLVFDFFYLHMLFGADFYGLLLPLSSDYNTAILEYAIIGILLIMLGLRFTLFAEKIVGFIRSPQNNKKIGCFGLLVVGLLAIATAPRLAGQAKHYPIEIWVSFGLAFLLPCLLLWAFVRFGQSFHKKLMIGNLFVGGFWVGVAIIFLVTAILVMFVFKDSGSLIYLASSITGFILSLILLLDSQTKKHIKQLVGSIYVVVGLVAVIFFGLVGVKIHATSTLLNAWQPTERAFSDQLQTKSLFNKIDCSILLSHSNTLTADDIQKIDACFEQWSQHNNNMQMRLYGWLFGHPLNHVLSSEDVGRLQNMEQLKAYHFPENLFFGDKEMISYSHLPVINGYEYEHIMGAVMIKPNGLLGLIILIIGWGVLFYAIPKQQIATRTLIAGLGFVTVYIGLQSLFVVPFFGNNSPLMTVSSFAKDTLPMIGGLVLFIIFGEALSIHRTDIEKTNLGV